MSERRRHPRPRHRAILRAEIGADAEELVWQFSRVSYRPEDVRRYIEDAHARCGAERELFRIRLANELAHYTDGAIRFNLAGSRPAENARLTSELARAMDCDELADELDYWIGYCAERPLSRREFGAPLEIELPARHWWEAGLAERAAVKLARSLRRWYRRGRASG